MTVLLGRLGLIFRAGPSLDGPPVHFIMYSKIAKQSFWTGLRPRKKILDNGICDQTCPGRFVGRLKHIGLEPTSICSGLKKRESNGPNHRREQTRARPDHFCSARFFKAGLAMLCSQSGIVLQPKGLWSRLIFLFPMFDLFTVARG